MPSLSEILEDPNYVNANEATKQAIFNKYSALDENFTSANPATQDAIRQKFGITPQPTSPVGQSFDVLGQKFTPEQMQGIAERTGILPGKVQEGEEAKGAFSGMFGRNLYNYAADMVTAWGRSTGNEDEAEEKAEKLRSYGERTYTPKDTTWKEDPISKIEELAGGSAPYILGPIMAGMLAPEGSIGLAAATFPRIAGIAAATPAFTGSNLQRQMEAEHKKLSDTNLLSAGVTAVGQATLDQVGFAFIPGVKNIFAKAGLDIADEAAEALVKKTILARAGELALKTGTAMTAEGSTEAAQQLLERLQAGLSLTNAEARKEYLENFVGGAVLGGVLGGPGHIIESMIPPEKKKEEEEIKKEEEKQKATVTEDQIISHANTRLQELNNKIATAPDTLTEQEKTEHGFLTQNIGSPNLLASAYNVNLEAKGAIDETKEFDVEDITPAKEEKKEEKKTADKQVEDINKEAEDDAGPVKIIRQPSAPKSAFTAPTLLGALKRLGGVTLADKSDVSGERTGFAPGGYNSIFTTKSDKGLMFHIESGSLDRFLPPDLRLQGGIHEATGKDYDPGPAYDYLVNFIRNGEKVLPFETQQEINDNLQYQEDGVTATSDVDELSQLEEDFINEQLRLAINEEKQTAKETKQPIPEFQDTTAVSGTPRETLELQGQTEEEIAKAEADQKAYQASLAQQQAQLTEEERKAREQEEIRQRSEAAASTFELGQTAEQNLTGQGDIFAGNTAGDIRTASRQLLKSGDLTQDQVDKYDAALKEPNANIQSIMDEMNKDVEVNRRDAADLLFNVSRGQVVGGLTVAKITDIIKKEFGRGVTNLIKNKILRIVESIEDIPEYAQKISDQVNAFYDPETNQAIIIANRTTPDMVRKIVLHEVGEHYGLRGMLGEAVYKQVLDAVERLKNTDPTIKKAWEKTSKVKEYESFSRDMFISEVIAKIGEDAPNHGIWKRIQTAIKTFLIKKGIVKDINANDLKDLVMHSLRTAINDTPKVTQTPANEIQYSVRPEDQEEAQNLESQFQEFNIPDAPFTNQKDFTDKFTENIDELKKNIKNVKDQPKEAVKGMISGVDKSLLDFRIKWVFFGAGVEQADFRANQGKLLNSQGEAVASVSLTNAIHAGHIMSNVMEMGHLAFDNTFKQFRAIASEFSMKNVFQLEYDLFKKLGKKTATTLIQTYFEAKRSRSIQNEFLNREAELEAAIAAGEDIDVAQRSYEGVIKAYQKIPAYFCLRDSNGNIQTTNIIKDGKVVDRIPIIDDEAIDTFIQKEETYPELAQMMQNWTSVNHNLLDQLVMGGNMSERRANHLKSLKDYVPWFRIDDGAEELHAPSTFVAGLTNISKEKKFKSGIVSKRIDNIVDNMVFNVMMMGRNAIRNYAALQIAKSYATRKENGRIATFKNEGVMPDGSIRTNILVNGKRVIIEIKDPNIAQGLLGMENLEMPMVNILSQFSQIKRRGITTNPIFQIKQVFKDAPTAAAVSGLKYPFMVWGKILGSFFMALNPNDPIVKTLKSFGVGGYYTPARTAEKEVKLSKASLTNMGPWLLKVLDRIGDASDYAQRRIIYKETLRQTGSEMEALFRANSVIDFMRHGNSKNALFLMRTVSFMNAYAQQIDVLGQSMVGGGFKGDRGKAAFRFYQTAAQLVAVSIIYAMLQGGDDEYDQLDDQTKMRNYIIMGMKFPMDTSFGFFFKSMPQLAYDYIIKEGTENEMDAARVKKAIAQAAWSQLLGPNPISSGALPFIEVGINHDFFTGSTVTPRSLEGLEPWLQYTKSTSELGKLISAGTAGVLNPIDADHIIKGLLGTAGALAMWGSDLFTNEKPERAWNENPLIGNLLLAPTPRGREEQFYDLAERSNRAYDTWNKLQERGKEDQAEAYFDKNENLIQLHDYISGANEGLKELNREINRLSDVPSSELSPQEKREAIDYFNQQKNELLEGVTQYRLQAEGKR